MVTAVLFFGIGCGVVAFITPFLILWSKKGWGMDQPDNFRKHHIKAIPRIGGISLYGAFLICFGLIWAFRGGLETEWKAIFCSLTLLFAIGLLDDFRPLGAKKKLLGQIAAALLAYWIGLRVELISYPVGFFSLDLGSWSLPVTVFWLVALPNIINLIDGIDGLATGLGLFLFVLLGFVGWSNSQMDVAWMAFACAGGVLGFLFFNFPPARIFLGDGGAYFIGFAVASLSVKSSNKGEVAGALLVTIIALGLPIMDTMFAIMRRGIQGFPLFRADAEHLHHRMEKLGISKQRVVLSMYFVSVVLSLMGLSVLWTQGRTLPIAVGALSLMALAAMRYLGYVQSWMGLRNQVSRALGKRSDVQYALLYAKVVEMEVERCQSFDEFEEKFQMALRQVGFLAEGEGEQDEAETIQLRFKSGHSLRLQAPKSYPVHYWNRLADCFHAPYAKALQKWWPAVQA